MHLWENNSKSKEWGVELAAGHNRNHSSLRLKVGACSWTFELCHKISALLAFFTTQLSQWLPAGKALKGEDILVYMNKAADTTGQCYWNTDCNSEANECSGYCVTHLVFLAILSTIGVSLHHCQGVLAAKGCSGWSNRALCCVQALFLPLCRHEFMFELCSFLTWNLTALERSKPKTQSSKHALNTLYF